MREGEKIECPSCKSTKCIPGQLQPDNSDSFIGYFYPLNIKYFVHWPSVKLDNGSKFSACLDCGHIWNKLDPVKLRNLLTKRGRTEEQLTKDNTPKHYLSWPVFLVISFILFIVLMIYGNA